jgi:hypothetical protein
MRCPSRTLTIALAATVLVACASPRPQGGIGPERYDSLQGQSGPVAWEVKNLRQTREEGGRQVTWWYDLILRNMGSAAIDFQGEDVGMIADDGSFGGAGHAGIRPTPQSWRRGARWAADLQLSLS